MSEIYKDYLEHSSKGSERKNHKYIDRKWKNGHWVYTYHDNANDKNGINKIRAREGRGTARLQDFLFYDNRNEWYPRDSYYRDKAKASAFKLGSANERLEAANKEHANRSKAKNTADEIIRKAGHTTASALTKSSRALNKGKNALSKTLKNAKPKVKSGGFDDGKNMNQKWYKASTKNGTTASVIKGTNGKTKYGGVSIGKAKNADDYKYVEKKSKKIGGVQAVYDNDMGTHNLTIYSDRKKSNKKRR